MGGYGIEWSWDAKDLGLWGSSAFLWDEPTENRGTWVPLS